MRETVTVELCPTCVLAIYLGTGFPDVVDELWRQFRGKIMVDATEGYTTFRPCGCCGSEETAIRYIGTAVLIEEEA